MAWFVALLACTGSLDTKYRFKPRADAAISHWKTAGLVLVFPMIFMVLSALVVHHSRCGQGVLIASALLFLALLVAGNILAANETKQREASEQTFAAKFNEFYCETRTARMCLEGNQSDLVVLTRGNEPALVPISGEGATSVTTAMWAHCRKVLLKYQAKSMLAEWNEDGRLYLSIYKFLDDSGHSSETDAWCGDLAHRATPLGDEEQRVSPAPYAANPDMFQSYTGEWTRSMKIMNGLLGSIFCCTALAAVLLHRI